MTNENTLLTVRQAAEKLTLQPSTLRTWIWQRRIEYVKIGCSVRLRPETIQQVIASGIVPAAEQ
jgi:excisionase family DNA binding protein